CSGGLCPSGFRVSNFGVREQGDPRVCNGAPALSSAFSPLCAESGGPRAEPGVPRPPHSTLTRRIRPAISDGLPLATNHMPLLLAPLATNHMPSTVLAQSSIGAASSARL